MVRRLAKEMKTSIDQLIAELTDLRASGVSDSSQPFLSSTDVAKIFDTSRTQIRRLMISDKDFPQPLATIGGALIWVSSQIQEYKALTHNRDEIEHQHQNKLRIGKS